MTSPPPAGALTATGKRVVRAVAEEAEAKEPSPRRLGLGKRTIAIAMCTSAVALIVLVVAIARKPRPATAPLATDAASIDSAVANAMAAADGGIAGPETQVATADSAHVEPVDDSKPSAASSSDASPAAVPTFGSGKVSHAVIVQVKMDGSIAAMHGARTASGFVVTVPGRRTLDSATLLGRADPRLASVKVANRSKGTELTFEFRGAVPSYLVRARGDRLQIALGQSDASAARSPVATRTAGTDHADERHRAARSEASDVRAASKTSVARSHH
jgi:hypothetical protein